MINVFIIILNWNRKKDTLECLESVNKLRSNGFKVRTVVVDNASTDGSVASLTELKDIEIIRNKKNLGFAEGNNVGIKYALNNKADYILILNNDTDVHKDLLGELISASKKHPDGGAFSPMIYFAKGFEFHKERYKKAELGKVIWSAGGNIDWNNVYGVNRGVDKVDTGQYRKIEEISFATGACVLYTAKAIKKKGAFDPKYFMYYEDVELSVRLTRAGFKIYFVPKAKLWHKVAQSSGIGSGLNDYFISRNRLLFGMKYASLRTRFALFREAIRLFVKGRPWQRAGVLDYMTSNLYKGSWK